MSNVGVSKWKFSKYAIPLQWQVASMNYKEDASNVFLTMNQKRCLKRLEILLNCSATSVNSVGGRGWYKGGKVDVYGQKSICLSFPDI